MWWNLPVLRQIPYKTLKRLLRETLTHPVEARAKIIHEPFSWILCADFAGELAGLLDVGVSRFDPEKVGVGSELLGALGGGGHAGFVVVVAFSCARNVPVEVHGRLGVFVCYGATLEEREVGVLFRFFEVSVDGGFVCAFFLEMLYYSCDVVSIDCSKEFRAAYLRRKSRACASSSTRPRAHRSRHRRRLSIPCLAGLLRAALSLR